MIPIKVSLQNFLSYGEQLQTISFEPYHLICLSGRNGHGKSALLDAMTWALWGQARKISGVGKADEGLLRLGARRMLVSFEFISQGQEYRVRREYFKTHGKPYTSLDIEVKQENGLHVSLTDKTIKRTEEKIERIIGLDFDTFVNSVFLRQGQSNEFSKKSPKERKHILATILGLAQYDALQQKAVEKVREYGEHKRLLTSLQAQAEEELVAEQAIHDEMVICKEKLATIIDKLAVLYKELACREDEQRQRAKEREAYERCREEYKQTVAQEQTLLTDYRHAMRRWQEIHVTLLSLPRKDVLEAKRALTVKQEDELRQAQQKKLDMQTLLLKEKELYQQRFMLVKSEHERDLYESRLQWEHVVFEQKNSLMLSQQWVKKVEELEHAFTLKRQERDVVIKSYAEKDFFEERFYRAKKQFDKRRAYYQTLLSRHQMINEQLAECDQKNDVLHDMQSPSCPLCEQVLTVKRKTFLWNKMHEQKRLLVYKKHRHMQLVARLKELLVNQHADLGEQEKKRETLMQAAIIARQLDLACQQLEQDLHIHQEELKKRLHESEIQAKNAALYEEKMKKLQADNRFLRDNELEVMQSRIAIIEHSIKALSYDTPAHEQVRDELRHLEHALSEVYKSDMYREEQKKHSLYMKHYAAQIKALRGVQQKFTARGDYEATLRKQEQELAYGVQKVQNERIEHERVKEEMLQHVGRYENQLARFALVRKEHRARVEKMKVYEGEIERYTTIAHAMSKNGMQALLIEQAIPEVEHEANILLSRLTDNQSQIFIESLRDLKKGGVKETLDIQISDAIGIRPYEMFSGGEAFRIDFALRIAISKLLARRAGTTLQTLIIDEGFGSQDEEALQRLMDCIYAIQSDFSKIIVISHLQALKENFPVHFVVEKGPLGSCVSVLERG